MFDHLITRQNNTFQSNIETLNQYAETHPTIKTFIELVTADTNSHTTWEDYVSSQLQLFMYDLGYSMHNIDSEINFNLDWSSTLLSFIGNFFLDDSYFNLKREKYTWKVYAVFDNGIQDPLMLIQAAQENAQYYWDCDNKLRIQREQRINQAMEK